MKIENKSINQLIKQTKPTTRMLRFVSRDLLTQSRSKDDTADRPATLWKQVRTGYLCFIAHKWIKFSRKVFTALKYLSHWSEGRNQHCSICWFITSITVWPITGITNRILTRALASAPYFCCGFCLVTGCNFLLATTCRVSCRIQPSSRAARSLFHTFAIC